MGEVKHLQKLYTSTIFSIYHFRLVLAEVDSLATSSIPSESDTSLCALYADDKKLSLLPKSVCVWGGALKKPLPPFPFIPYLFRYLKSYDYYCNLSV